MEATAVVFSDILFRLTELEEIPIDADHVQLHGWDGDDGNGVKRIS